MEKNRRYYIALSLYTPSQGVVRTAHKIANEKGVKIVRGFIEECWRNEGLEIRTAIEAARIYKASQESKGGSEAPRERYHQPAKPMMQTTLPQTIPEPVASPKKASEKPAYQQPQNLETRRDLIKSLWQASKATPAHYSDATRKKLSKKELKKI